MNSNVYSVTPNAKQLISLRHRLGWTQQDAAAKAGYSERLIRKIEKPLPVRSQTLRDVVQAYFDALGEGEPDLQQFIQSSHANESTCVNEGETDDCPLAARMREYYDVVYQQRKLDRISEFACDKIRFTSEGETRVGIDAIQQRASALLDAFDPIKFTIDRSITQNQIVISYWTVEMLHAGAFFDIPASGRWVRVRGNSTVEFAENLVVEGEDQFDVDDLIRQLTGQERRFI